MLHTNIYRPHDDIYYPSTFKLFCKNRMFDENNNPFLDKGTNTITITPFFDIFEEQNKTKGAS